MGPGVRMEESLFHHKKNVKIEFGKNEFGKAKLNAWGRWGLAAMPYLYTNP
jgi:hypothetical protein